MKIRSKPFAKTTVVGNELSYLATTISSGQLAGDGFFSKKCEQFLEKTLGVPRVLLTPSCTHALELAALLLDLKKGDEVILPSFTFVSTANAFVLRGARPVFLDIRPDTLNLNEKKVSDAFSKKTKALVLVHYGGVGCEMLPILRLARQRGVPVIEDNAHGLFGRHRGRWLGTFGDLATLSFHQTKNFSCGEGGALVINRKSLIHRAEILREKGTDRKRFLRGEIDKYTWRDVGSSYLPSELSAAFLFGQLRSWRTVQSKRRKIWLEYDRSLREWCKKNKVGQPFNMPGRRPAWHVYYLLLPSVAQRNWLIKKLKAKKINAVFHYLPLHSAPGAKKLGAKSFACSTSTDIGNRMVRLPLHLGLSMNDIQLIIHQIRKIQLPS